MSTSLDPPKVPALPPLVATYVEATNSFDLERLLAAFADDALVDDQLRGYRGREAIRVWAARDIIGQRLTMVPTSARPSRTWAENKGGKSSQPRGSGLAGAVPSRLPPA
jgi:hypothetical protein